MYLLTVLIFYYFAAVIRLVNGTTGYEGRVEVYHNGVWGTVCNNGWDLNDTKVVCRQLGFGPPMDAKSEEFYGQGSGPIWLGDVSCTGKETMLRECSYNGWGINNCHHTEDVGIKCAPSNGMYLKLIVVTYVHM